jgi:ribosomal protein S18 acetylase RimI-like enzyme
MRGRGIAKALVKALLDAGRRKGHSHAGISVTTGNTAAQRAYEAAGFKMYTAYGADYFDGYYPGSTKYRIALS